MDVAAAEIAYQRMIAKGMGTDFNITGEDDNKTAVLNLNQAENNEGVSDNAFLVEIGNTFIENFELSSLTLKENGADLAGATDLTYVADYENVD